MHKSLPQIFLSCLCVLACSARAAPQNYGVLEVLESQPEDLGPYGNIVAATIDILPDIADVFENISRSRSSLDPTDSNSVLDVIMAFIPISEKVLEAMAKAEGRTLRPEERERLHRIKDVLPSYFAFMQNIRSTNFYGFSNSYGLSPSHAPLLSGGKPDPNEDKTSDKATNNFSGSFVKLPIGKSYFISHDGHAQ